MHLKKFCYTSMCTAEKQQQQQLQSMVNSRKQLNTKMLSFQYGNSHSKDKMVVRLSYQYNVNPIPWKIVFILKSGPVLLSTCTKKILHFKIRATPEEQLEDGRLFHRPNGRHGCCARDCQWPPKNSGNSHWSGEPTMPPNSGNSNLYSDQPITKGWCQAIRGHVSYPTDSHNVARLWLCNSMAWWGRKLYPKRVCDLWPDTHLTQPLWANNSNLLKNSFWSDFCSDDAIRSQFCTCHDSSAVMSCVKLWPDIIIIFHIKASIKASIFTKSELWAIALIGIHLRYPSHSRFVLHNPDLMSFFILHSKCQQNDCYNFLYKSQLPQRMQLLGGQETGYEYE